jgi:flagellin
MPQTVNSNIVSLNAQRNLNRSQGDLSVAMQRLSSGLRINSAKDDAAGLAISERMSSQIRGFNQAARNANDGISLAQTAESALGQVTDLVQRMRELAVQSANSTNSASDRSSLQLEVNQLKQELDRVSSSTEFNGLKLLNGSFTTQSFQIGANANQTISFSIAGASSSHLANNKIDAVGSTTVNQGSASTTAVATALPANNTVAAQTLTLSGNLGSSTVGVGVGNSAYTIANSINAKEASTGVTAKAQNSAIIDTLSANGTVTMTLGSGGNTATISAAVTTTDLGALSTEINKVTGTTGISASVNGGALTLSQADGKDIRIADFTHSTAASTVSVKAVNESGTGVDAATLTTGTNDSSIVTGFVTFNSSNSFSVSSSVAETAGSILNVAANTSVGSTQQLLSAVDIGSAAGAQTAITILDASLQTVSRARADMGAMQSRFEMTITNLQASSENLSAAKSRIMDADFAEETSKMTRAQIMQQAGTAMVAQANALPQGVLSLLRG